MQNSTFVSSVSIASSSSYQLLRKYDLCPHRLQLEPSGHSKDNQKVFLDYFRRLSDDERQEWVDNMLNKCYMSYRHKRYDNLKEDLVFVVYTTHEEKCTQSHYRSGTAEGQS